MIKGKALLNFCGMMVFIVTLIVFGSHSVYGAYAEYTFDKTPASFFVGLPLSFVENGIIMNASADSVYWHQTDYFTFNGLSGGVLTNGLRLAAYPSETLTLQFSAGLLQFNTDYAIASPDGGSGSLTLVAYCGTNKVGSAEGVTNSGSITFASFSLFDRVELTSTAGVDFAIDNVQVNTVPLPGALLLMASGLTGLLGLRRKC